MTDRALPEGDFLLSRCSLRQKECVHGMLGNFQRCIQCVIDQADADITELKESLGYAADVMERHGWQDVAKDSAEYLAWTACRIARRAQREG